VCCRVRVSSEHDYSQAKREHARGRVHRDVIASDYSEVAARGAFRGFHLAARGVKEKSRVPVVVYLLR
jgi:hypothetical protein